MLKHFFFLVAQNSMLLLSEKAQGAQEYLGHSD